MREHINTWTRYFNEEHPQLHQGLDNLATNAVYCRRKQLPKAS